MTTHNTQSEEQRKSEPHIVTNHPSGNLVISIGTKVENRSSTSKKQYLGESETEEKHSTKYQKTKDSSMNIPKSEVNQTSNNLKIIDEPNLHHIENKCSTIQSS